MPPSVGVHIRVTSAKPLLKPVGAGKLDSFVKFEVSYDRFVLEGKYLFVSGLQQTGKARHDLTRPFVYVFNRTHVEKEK